MGYRSGTNGNDTISVWGEGEAYLVFGKGGDDIIAGSDYGDGLYGGADNDVVLGNAGADYIDGEAGDDGLHGGADNDTLHGRVGDDELKGDAGNDTAWGQAGRDHLEGGVGNDYLNGGEEDDEIYGYVAPSDRYPDGPPPPYRGTDDDTLVGGAGNDRLHGGPGADTLIGGTGYDTLTGGIGADVFKYSAYDVVTRTVTIGAPPFHRTITYETIETDTIIDFDAAGGDRINLDLLLTQTNFGANTSAADAIAQGYIYWVEHGQPGQAGFGTTVYVDRNGGAHNATGLFGMGDFAVADLQGVAATDLGPSHYLV
jgi:Ca2+-binding RTX toxin-like protein